ncbi:MULTISPECIES: CoA transferase [unclassified Nocardioides]|uniref:CaiB/BaiF CoA transferase family protein n=1 Tax=unclassified Nocardioides TaxID=2615069 RepID=UPI000056FA26|nr:MULTISPECIES: CoA transferase [unclassified Nocardioides]ABL81665.1 L-carnitine dehydratase/bile acid-inducible protein F [Nocardioides sp. JS614]
MTDGDNSDLRPRPGPLRGTTVIDMTRALAGPHAAMLLGDLGAHVIKVESAAGDESRSWGPPFIGDGDDDRVSTYFLAANRNKQSFQLDLKSGDDISLLIRLVRHADVLMENFRPGVLERLGLPPERLLDINPKLVVLSITGLGHDGPEGARPGYDQIAQGEAGLMSITGPPGEPTRVGVPIADLLAGIYGAYGTLAAILRARETGEGAIVRTSLLAAICGVHSFQATRFLVGGENPVSSGNHHPSIAPYGTFTASDGIIQIAAANDRLWSALAHELRIDPTATEFATNQARVAHRAELIESIETRLTSNTSDHWIDVITAAGVPCGRVRSIEDVYEWPQALSQGLVIQVEHETAGRLNLPGSPVRIENRDGADLMPSWHLPPPGLGEHNRAVRDWLDQRDSIDNQKH